MTSQDDEKDKDGNLDGYSLWDTYTQDIKPLNPKKYRKKKVIEPPRVKEAVEREASIKVVIKDIPWEGGLYQPPMKVENTSSYQIDKSTALKLRRGQIPIDARIDLHGLYQHEARNALLSFIGNAYHRQHRCILVVTGKGKFIIDDRIDPTNAPGVIKRNFKGWLAQEPYASMILKIQKAQIKDGGEGAYYILLRKKRI